MVLYSEAFVQKLDRNFPASNFLIAYSGGLDSTVLLHLCALGGGPDAAKRFHAIHVDHGLHADSGGWSEHCRRTCAELGIRCQICTLRGVAKSGRSLEEVARTARYEAMKRLMKKGDVVLLAQHRDDQAETILLQLLRGAGLQGLSGMPESIAFGSGILHRPLLNDSRQSIRDFAQLHGLNWIEDPSNENVAHDRNYLRHEIIPRIKARWPGMDKTLARSGRHCAEAQTLLDSEVERWLETLIESDRNTLSIPKLIEFEPSRQRRILRAWIHRSGFRHPSTVVLERVLHEVVGARGDRSPLVRWEENEIRRHRNRLYLCTSVHGIDPDRIISWSLRKPLPIPELGGILECRLAEATTRHLDLAEHSVTVRFRKGGERCNLPGRAGSRSLKKLFQELGVPPWERDRIPLIYLDDELAAIGDLVICEPFRKAGIQLHWIPMA